MRPKPLTDVASIDAFEWRHNSDGVRGDLNSDPYDVLALGGNRQIVADAGANAIVEANGRAVRLLAVVRGPGRAQRVPTSLALGPDGDVYVGELADLRSQSAPGRLTRIAPDGRRTSFSRGLLFPQGAAVADNGDVYLSNFSVLPARTPTRSPFRGAGGEVVKVSGL